MRFPISTARQGKFSAPKKGKRISLISAGKGKTAGRLQSDGNSSSYVDRPVEIRISHTRLSPRYLRRVLLAEHGQLALDGPFPTQSSTSENRALFGAQPRR